MVQDLKYWKERNTIGMQPKNEHRLAVESVLPADKFTYPRDTIASSPVHVILTYTSWAPRTLLETRRPVLKSSVWPTHHNIYVWFVAFHSDSIFVVLKDYTTYAHSHYYIQIVTHRYTVFND